MYRHRLGKNLGKVTLDYVSSLNDDMEIALYDIVGSQAHAIMLYENKIITKKEINVSITELELIDEVDIQDSNVKVDLHLTSPFCPAVFGFKICQDVHDNLLKIDGIDDVKVNVSNHFMAEQINNQVNNSPNPHKKE